MQSQVPGRTAARTLGLRDNPQCFELPHPRASSASEQQHQAGKIGLLGYMVLGGAFQGMSADRCASAYLQEALLPRITPLKISNAVGVGNSPLLP